MCGGTLQTPCIKDVSSKMAGYGVSAFLCFSTERICGGISALLDGHQTFAFIPNVSSLMYFNRLFLLLGEASINQHEPFETDVQIIGIFAFNRKRLMMTPNPMPFVLLLCWGGNSPTWCRC